MKRPYRLLLLAGLILAIYYPAISAGVCYIDDQDLLRELLNRDGWNLKEIFLPGTRGGLYYRPLVDLSFVIDRQVWFLSESFIHLENIFLHVLNAILVYFLCESLLREKGGALSSYVPLSAAAIFGLHPLMTESVSWICGRTDLLAATFVLSGALLLFRFRESAAGFNLLASLAAVALGVISKEVAVAFLPGVYAILTAEKLHKGSRPARIAPYILLAAIIIGVAACFRFVAYKSPTPGIAATVTYFRVNPEYSSMLFLRAFGFYLTKLFIPFPQNLAIVEVDPLYELIGLLLVQLCCILFQFRSVVTAVFLSGILLLTPVLPITLNQIAWTPFAERYMYLPSAFIIPSVIVGAERFLKHEGVKQQAQIGLFCLLALAAILTYRRNLLWKDPVSLLRDATEKSPNFHMVRNNYGVALMEAGDFEGAKREFEKAWLLSRNPEPQLNLGDLYYRWGKPQRAVEAYRAVMARYGAGNGKANEHMARLLENELLRANGENESESLKLRLVVCYEHLYKLQGAPHTAYRLGQLFLALGQADTARCWFEKAGAGFSPDSPYYGFTKRIIARLPL